MASAAADALQSLKIENVSCAVILVFVDDRDVLAAALLQKLAGLEFGKARVARLDDKEKAVVGRATEAPPVEDRVIPARQAVHNQHGEKRAESSEENRELEHDREKGGHRPPVDWFAMNYERIDEP